MNILTKLRRKPRYFQAVTGLTPAQFDTPLAEFTPVYETAMSNKRQKPGRLRQPGAGRPFALAVQDRLLMGLMYLHLYVSQSLLSYLFDLDESNVTSELRVRLLPILQDVLPPAAYGRSATRSCPRTKRYWFCVRRCAACA